MYLSKSKYCSGVQCPKMLWLKNNKPEEFDDSIENGSAIDASDANDLAKGLFGPYVEVPYGDLSEMIQKTEELICNGTPIITEASFSYEGLFCSVDILRNLSERHVELYEVKSSTKIEPIYYDDIAYQVYVLTKLGFTVDRACLVCINNQYVRHGALDLQGLFQIVDLTTETRDMYSDIENNLKLFEEYLFQSNVPEDDIGPHCFDPYKCGFWRYCARELPKPNVFDLADTRINTKFKCYFKGIVSYEELNTCSLLKEKQYQQICHELNDCAPTIINDEIKAFLADFSYPMYFLDFESFNPAVPRYDESKPFEQIVFQYSLHYIDCEGGELQHTEFLAYPSSDPRRALAEQLCKDIPMNVCIVAYNMTFEKTRLKELASLYPDLAEHLTNIRDNMRDLMVPFHKRWYYSRALQGSYSIKSVLPTLFPDDPTLDYHNLEGVHNGAEASVTFLKMASMQPDELQISRHHLLKYCGLDTFALVKIWEKLNEMIK